MGTGEPPNQQGQDQSINAATLAFKEEVALLSSVWALTGLEMALPPLVNHPLWREPPRSVVSQHRDKERRSGTGYEAQATALLLHLPQTTG